MIDGEEKDVRNVDAASDHGESNAVRVTVSPDRDGAPDDALRRATTSAGVMSGAAAAGEIPVATGEVRIADVADETCDAFDGDAVATVDEPCAPRSRAGERKRSQKAVAVAVALVSVVVIGLSATFLFRAPDSSGAADVSGQSEATAVRSSANSNTPDADGDAADDATDGDGANAADDSNADADSAESVAAASSNASASAGARADAGSSTASAASAASGTASGSSGAASSGGAASSAPAAPDRPATVTVSVGVSGSGYGNVSGGGTFTFAQGATAYDALMACGLSVNASQSQYGVYVSAIGGLAEKEHGGASGWVYSVNGTQPMTSCNSYVLADGDTVQWYYVA